MFVVILSAVLVVAAAQNSVFSEYGKSFHLGILKNYEHDTSATWLEVTTNLSEVVFFNVTYGTTTIQKNTTLSSPTFVTLPTSSIVTSSGERNKGIKVASSAVISVVTFNWEDGSVGDYLAFPCHDMSQPEYEYYIISSSSVRQVPALWSQALLVGCHSNTTVTITPSRSLNLPINTQSGSQLITVTAGTSHTVMLHEGQTLYFGKPNSDITGTRVVSTKPLTVISGHECGNVPSSTYWCEQLNQQIPPTAAWGKEFLLVPFLGRESGQYFKVVASQDDTVVNQTCNGLVTKLLAIRGNSYTFFVNSATFCYAYANKPIAIVQLSTGGYIDGVGDPIMIYVQPIEQYSQKFMFTTQHTDQFAKSYISITVTPTNFITANILYDDTPIAGTWTAIYNSQHVIVGYGNRLLVNSSGSHSVTHTAGGLASVMVYGFSTNPTRGYGYPAGINLTPIDYKVVIQFSSSEYIVMENMTQVIVTIQRNVAFHPISVTIVTKPGTASNTDFKPLHEVVSFGVGETHKEVNITIINDEWVEPPEQFILQLSTDNGHTDTTKIIIRDDDYVTIGFLSPLYRQNSKVYSLLVRILSGILQPGSSAVVIVHISILQDGSVYSATHNVNLTYYMYKTQLYFDFSRILLHRELKAGSLVRAQLLKTNKGVNIVIGHHSFSQVITIPSTASSFTKLTSFTLSKLSPTNSPSFTLLSSMKRPLSSTKQLLSTSSTSSSSQTERVLPTVLSDTQTEFNFLNLLAIILASTSIVFIILLLIILITILLRKRHHSPPLPSATNPYEVRPPPHQLEEIYDIPTAPTDNKIYYEDLK